MSKKLKRSDHHYKHNRDKEKKLKEIAKGVEKERRQNQCSCLHSNDHGPDVRLLKNHNHNGSIMFQCKNCEKKIRGNKISEKLLTDSINIVDAAIDTIKMQLKTDKPNDLKVANWIAETQYHLVYNIFQLYAATQKNKNDYIKAQSSIFGKPVIRKERRR